MERKSTPSKERLSLKPTESVYEVKATDKQAVSLLEIVNEINGQLDAAKTLRRQRDGTLSQAEKVLIDRTFEESGIALSDVARLVEPCQVEMKSNKGNLAFGKRLVYILRDSPEIMGTLVRLGFESQRLQAALDILCGREVLGNPSWLNSLTEIHQPPTYEESQSMIRRSGWKGLQGWDSITTSQQRPSNLNAAIANDSLVEDFIALGPLIDATSNKGSPRPQQDELFFDCVADQSGTTARTSLYQPYRQIGGSADSTTPPAWASRTTSELDLRDAPQVDTSFVSARRSVTSKSMGSAQRSRPFSHIPTPLAMLNTHASAALDTTRPPDLSSVSKLKSHSKPFVRPKPAALRAEPRNDTLSHDATSARANKKRDWESLPSQQRKATKIPTFVLTCPPSDLDESSPRRLMQHMVKLDDHHAQPEEVSSVQIEMIPGSLQPGRSTIPSLQSEFPEVVPASSMPSASTISPDLSAQRPHSKSSQGIALVTEVSVDMIARSRSCRQAHLLDRANHAPEVVPDGAPDVGPLIPLDTRESVTSAGGPAGVSRAHQRHLPVSSESYSLDIERDSAVVSARESRQSLLTGRARSQRWRELQYERSQTLERGRWFK